MTNDIEILTKLSEIKQSISEVEEAIKMLTDIALSNRMHFIEEPDSRKIK